MRFYKILLISIGYLFSVASYPGFADTVPSLLKNSKPLEIVRQCEYVEAGVDQVSDFQLTIINRFGQVRETVYRRYWKRQDLHGSEPDKLALFALRPLDIKNTAFLRLSYPDQPEKGADQWVYLPSLHSLKQLSRRNLGDSFLGSDLTYGDMSVRHIDEDEHVLLEVNEKDGELVFIIESRPRESDALYARKLNEYHYSQKDNVCLKRHVTYFDRINSLLKVQKIDWQQVSNAWLWKRVEVKNAKTFSASFFEINDATVNVGLSDKWFTKRIIQRGL